MFSGNGFGFGHEKEFKKCILNTIMLTVPILGFRYGRLMAAHISPEEIEKLKQDFSYLFVVTYGDNPPTGDWQVQKRQAFVIDLTQSINRVFDNFKKNTRNEIRRAENDPSLSFVSNDHNWKAAYKRYKKFEQARKWMSMLKAEFKRSVLFNAYHRGDIISGIACYGHNDTLRVNKIFSIRNHNTRSDLSVAVIGYASRKLIYDICQYGIKNNYTRLDLGGVNFTDNSKIGISQFKQSFGGDLQYTHVSRYMTRGFSVLKRFLTLIKKDIN